MRSSLTNLAVALVLATLLLGRMAGQRAEELDAAQAPQINLEVPGQAGQSFAENLLDQIRAHPAVAVAAPSLLVAVQSNGLPLNLRGVEPGSYAAWAC